MSNTQTNWTFNLIDAVTGNLNKMLGGMKIFDSELKDVNLKFDVFGKSGKQATKKVENSIAGLKNKLSILETQKEESFDVNEIKKFNKEIDDLTIDIDKLSNSGREVSKSFSFTDLNNAVKIESIANSFDALADSLNFADEIGTVNNKINQLIDGTPEQIKKITRESYKLSQIYGDDQMQIVQAANAMTQNLGGSFEQNLAIINEGYQKGANLNENFLDQMREYPSALADIGISAEQMTAIISEANKKGVWDDKAIDTIKESIVKLSVMTDSQKDILNSIGVTPAEITKMLNEGQSIEAIQKIVGNLKTLDKTSQQVAIGELFGSMGEDAKGVILNFDEFALSLDEIETKTTKYQETKNKFTGWMADIKVSVFESTKSFLPFIQASSAGLGTLTQLSPAVSAISKGFGKFGKGITKMAGGILKSLVPALLGATGSQWSLNVAMNANPVGAIIIGVIAIGAAITILVVKMNNITAWFKKLNKTAKAFVVIGGIMLVMISPIIGVIFGLAFAIRKLIDNWSKITAWFKKFGSNISAFMAGLNAVFQKIFSVISKVLQPVIIKIKSFIDEIKTFVNSIVMTVRTFITSIVMDVKAFLNKVITGIINFVRQIPQVFNNVKLKIIEIFGKIRTFISSVFERLGLSQFAQKLISPFLKVKEVVFGVFQNIFDFLSEKFAFVSKIAEKLGMTDLATTFKVAFKQDKKEQRQEAYSNVFAAGIIKEEKQQNILPEQIDYDKLVSNLDNSKPVEDNNITNNNLKQGDDNNITNNNSTVSGSNNNTAKSITMNLDIKNYFNVGADNLNAFTQKVKAIITDVIVDASRDAAVVY